MIVKVNKTFGDTMVEFVVEQPKTADAIFEAAGIANAPTKCGLCGSEEVTLESNRAQDKYNYVKVSCNKCFAKSTMGENLGGLGIFWKQFEKFEKKD